MQETVRQLQRWAFESKRGALVKRCRKRGMRVMQKRRKERHEWGKELDWPPNASTAPRLGWRTGRGLY